MHDDYNDDEVTGEYPIDMTDHARVERIHGVVIWIAIALSLVGLAAALVLR